MGANRILLGLNYLYLEFRNQQNVYKIFLQYIFRSGLVYLTTRIVSIVDDEINITELFQDALCSNIAGISVISFNDPTLALEHYNQNKKNYALIISDMRMPTMTGLELLKNVKELNPNVRTMLISAFDMQDNPDFQKYSKDGVID
jgi:DNA-binding NtrC family response regulator